MIVEVPPPLDTAPPTVSVTSPASGATVSGTVALAATASDDVGVTQVEFRVDGTLVGTDATAPYGTTWDASAASIGFHTVAATAYDAAGNSSTSAITVILDNTAPTGAIVINDGAFATRTRAVTLSLSATDVGSGVSTMAFSNDGTTWSSPVAYAQTYAHTLSSGTGKKTVYARFTDAAGNVSAVATDTIILDTAAPTSRTISINAGAAYTNSTSVTLTLSATDTVSGVSTMAFSTDGTTWSSPVPFVTSYPYVVPAGDSTKTVSVRYTDYAGNTSTAVSDSIVVHTGLPTVLLTSPTAGSTVRGTVALAATASDSIGVTRVEFYVDTTRVGSDASSPYTASWSSSSYGMGEHVLRAVAYDAAGNSSTSAITVILDNTAPTGAIVINDGAFATRTRAVTLSLSATDVGSGVSTMAFSNDGTTWSSPVAYAQTHAHTLSSGTGKKTVYARFTDAAGNVSAVATDTIILDTAAPTSRTISINAGAAYTNSTSVTLTLSATDTVSGVSTMAFSTDGTTWSSPVPFVTSYPYVVPAGDSTKTVSVRYTDYAGNTSTAVSDSIVVHTGLPTVLLTSPTAGSTVRGTVALAATASDSIGVTRVEFYVDTTRVGSDASSPYTASWSSSSYGMGEHVLRAVAYDAAGNSSTSAITVILDNTAP